MRIPLGFGYRDVTKQEVLDAQMAFLTGTMTDEQKRLIDAIISWFKNNSPLER